MMIQKLAEMPYAQAHVEIDNDSNIYFFSYVTLVCVLTADKWFFCTGTYTPTTKKQIDAFGKEYITWPNGDHLTWRDAEACFRGNYKMNIETGEIEDL